MSATNYTPIYLYNSGTATNTPSASNLGAGELAINYADGKLFYKDGSSAVQVIAWKTTPTTAGGTGLTSYTAGDLPYYASGSALSKLGIGTANYVLTSSGTAPQYVAQSTLSVGTATNATNTAITDNTSSSATWYPTIVSATTGNLPQTTSSTKLSFVPSTGTLTATSYGGAWAGSTIGTTYGGTGQTSYTDGQLLIGNSTGNTLTKSTLTAGNGISITNGSGAITVATSGAFYGSAPVTATSNYSVVSTDLWIINNKTGSSLTVTLPLASTSTGRELTIQNYQAFTVISASSNVVYIGGGSAGTAILAASVGDSATLVSDGTNWVMMQYASNNNLLLE